ncbi:MAG: hypothetical protein Q7T26_03015 [Dehalococcoidia bacterium]|nr:hypothetical protein [Dehalococcoidia bacterium]
MEPQEFKRRRKQLAQTIWNAVTIYAIWKELQSRSEEEAAGLNRYKGFFQPVLYALRQAFVVEFWKIFDPDSHANSLDSLIAAARNEKVALAPRTSDDELAEIGRLLRPHRKVIERWRRLRITSVHDDVAPQKPDSPLIIREANAMAEAAVDAFNRLSSAHDGQAWIFQYQPGRSAWETREVKRIMAEERKRAGVVSDNRQWGLEVAEKIKDSAEKLRIAIDDRGASKESMRPLIKELQDAAHNMWTFWESMNR